MSDKLQLFANMSKQDKLKCAIINGDWHTVLIVDAIDPFDWVKIINGPVHDTVIKHLKTIMPIDMRADINLCFKVGHSPSELDLSQVDADTIINALTRRSVILALDGQGLLNDFIMTHDLGIDVTKMIVSTGVTLSNLAKEKCFSQLHWRNYIKEGRHDMQLYDVDAIELIETCIEYNRHEMLERFVQLRYVTNVEVLECLLQLQTDDRRILKICRDCITSDHVTMICVAGMIDCVEYVLEEKICPEEKVLFACAYCNDDDKRQKMFALLPGVVISDDMIASCLKNDNLRPLMRLAEDYSTSICHCVLRAIRNHRTIADAIRSLGVDVRCVDLSHTRYHYGMPLMNIAIDITTSIITNINTAKIATVAISQSLGACRGHLCLKTSKYANLFSHQD